MANRNRGMNILLNQVDVDVGGDVDQLLDRWDPNPTVHRRLLNKLRGRVTEAAPLRLLWEKNLTAGDVSGQQSRFVLSRNVVENKIVRCLTSQQRDDLCNNRAEIEIAAFDEQARKWVLKLRKRMQRGNANGTYVLIGGWAAMVRENGWKEGDEIKIYGLPYVGTEDQQRFGPRHDFSDITFVFTRT